MKKLKLIDKVFTKKEIKKIEKKVLLLGDNASITAEKFLNLRLLTTLLIFLSFLLFSQKGYIYAPVFSVVYYLLYEYIVLDLEIKKRTARLEKEALFYFEILQLSLESGKTLSSAIQITSENVSGELADEFKKVLEEVRLGKSLIESLKAMKFRIPSDTINNTILNITESSIFGSNIIDSLNNQLNYLRNKKMLEVKGKIAKLPMKISIVSVLFFIPIILLIILSPVVLEFILR